MIDFFSIYIVYKFSDIEYLISEIPLLLMIIIKKNYADYICV